MNFLAHAILSGNDDELLIGNFIADAVKGKQYDRYSMGIRKGILLHREIDSFTDHHPEFLRSKARIMPEYGRFSGIVVDIYYDHFLARKWNDYTEKDLSEFVLHIYRLMLQNYDLLPLRSRRILPYMIIHNWLVGYSRFGDLQWVFNGMSRRTNRYHSGMENAVKSLRDHYDAFERDFTRFFPEMLSHAEKTRAGLRVLQEC
jgi:acyl carrier protein phosphodiesterase